MLKGYCVSDELNLKCNDTGIVQIYTCKDTNVKEQIFCIFVKPPIFVKCINVAKSLGKLATGYCVSTKAKGHFAR